MKRQFAFLKDYEALHVAIFIEERNARIYENFAQMFQEFNDEESRAIATAFQEMAAEERNHGHALQERYVERFGTRSCNLTDQDIEDVIEVPQLEDGEMFIVGRVPRQKALEVALAAERQARDWYTRLAALTVDAPLRGLYQDMASFERDHEKLLEDKLARFNQAAQEKHRV